MSDPELPGGAQAPEGADQGDGIIGADLESEVEPGALKESAHAVDPDLPETDPEDEGGEGEPEEEEEDPTDVYLPLNHAKELVDNLRSRGYEDLANAFLAVEAGGTITIHVEV